MNNLFTIPAERTESSDAIYGAIGRALTFATQFESNCRALAILLGFKNEVDENQDFSLSNQEDIDRLVAHVQSQRLVEYIKAIGTRFVIKSEVGDILHRGRKARNLVAHEFTVGLEYEIQREAGQYACLASLRSVMHDLAEANLIVSLLSLVITREELPVSDFVTQFPARVIDWVCEID